MHIYYLHILSYPILINCILRNFGYPINYVFLSRNFRDQNFGLNELAAIQDVRNDFNLQDITDEPPLQSSAASKDRGMF